MTCPVNSNPFEQLSRDKRYLRFKSYIFNYRFRKWHIARYVPPEGTILDIGSGPVSISPDLTRTVAVDIASDALEHTNAKQKVVASIEDLPFESGAFDCILCSEVLEHIADDGKAIRELRRVLAAGGMLVITVPFRMRFWAADDEYVGHVRRYEPDELEQKLRSSGFNQVTTVKSGGRFERWLTRKSLKVYQNKAWAGKAPFLLYKAVNDVLYILLVAGLPLLRWRNTTRVLITAR